MLKAAAHSHGRRTRPLTGLAALAVALWTVSALADPDVWPPLDRLQAPLLRAQFAKLDARPKTATELYAIGNAKPT